jgi:beta-lactam-binding protein with PASTA domain
MVISQTPTAGTEVFQGTAVDLVVSQGGIAVPNVVGQAQNIAMTTIINAGLVVGTVAQRYSVTVPSGNVISQTPATDTPVMPDTVVDLIISLGGIAVPDLIGQSQVEATTTITNAILAIGTLTQEYSPTVLVGLVIAQTPVAGSSVLPGTTVNLVVSLGIQPIVMPDVVGQPQAQAQSAITGAGLVLGTTTQDNSATVPAGNVISQSPAPGAELPPGTAVSIVVSLGPVPPVEGEGELPVDTNTAQQQLAELFNQTDTNGDGNLSFEEAMTAVPGLTQTIFDALDTNGDGQLSQSELGLKTGCGFFGCSGSKTESLGDLFLLGLSLMTLPLLSRIHR